MSKEITITVSGPVGCGKSAIAGEIEIAMKAIGVPVRMADQAGDRSEKNMTGADWTGYLEMYKPNVVIVESINTMRTTTGLTEEALARLIDNAGTASQNLSLVDDAVTREAIRLNVIDPIIHRFHKHLALINVLVDALEAVDGEILLTGQVKGVVDAALAFATRRIT